jgi:alpha-galactosidase
VRSTDWQRSVVFNSNGVDANRISTGAKDDMDFAEVERQAEVANRLGVETFVLDDGWQAASGDWCPDSPECPEPRGKYPPRFPDARFEAVREAIAPMKLGLWMTPMHFNPAAEAYERNPQWNCEPVGEGLVGLNRATPDDGSNEAGIGTWNPEATGHEGRLIDYIESRIRRAIEEWEVEYFKFDFLVWLDCAGLDTVTAYDYRESFIRMLDRLIEDYPRVTFQIDETNDYRLFPFESVYRGPSWYANGHPKASEALHNLWVLSPYVPGYTLGQAALGQRDTLSADYLMAVALGSHMTFFTDLTRFTEQQVEAVARWTEIYREHRERFATFAYPLLEDPLPGDNWTGLQPWDPETGRGALLVFRQDSPDETRVVPLRGIRGDGSFRLTDAETGEPFGVFTADELRSGIPVTLPSRFSAKVLLIDPVAS